ncbi:hypothetical protein AURDEDRAFT_116214 [Auricularia subglabra TFB-10046 SS5]|nr:hypothetical protein AURDEDRAFT_116214 [Auricularia subglabra TFB-10046 SS5]
MLRQSPRTAGQIGPIPPSSSPVLPPVWNGRSPPFRVEKDNFDVYIDQNGHRVPAFPLLPLIAAVQHMHPDFAFSNVDIVTDRNSLRKLLRWIRGRESDSTVKEFRIDVQMNGRTMLFTRRESKTKELSNRAYGIGFERACTSAPPGQAVPRQTGHHRVVKYNLEDMELLVRFELDACLPAPVARSGPDIGDLLSRLDRLGISGGNAAEATTGRPVGSNPAGSLTAQRAAQPPASTAAAASARSSSELVEVIPSGTLVPQSSTIELTTVSKKFQHSFSWPENYPQLFLSQTAHHFLGVHEFGKFTTIRKSTLQSMTEGTIGRDQRGDLKRLGRALRDIYNRVAEQNEGTLLCLDCAGGVLRLYRRTDGKQALPQEALALFSQAA